MPSKVELKGLNRIMSKNNELEELIRDEEGNSERIINAIEKIIKVMKKS